MKSITYKTSGVDVDAGNALARWIGSRARATHRPELVSGIGGFAGLFRLPRGLEEPLLVASTDGVGTKLKLAFATGRHATIGVDLVAMNVNDLLCVGAEPLFFLDYFAVGTLELPVAQGVLEGVLRGCEEAGCTLLGGETAELPGFYSGGEYDLAGFVVGVVEASRVIDGRKAAAGDLVVGVASSGLHSNGYSLARRVLVGEGADLDAVVPEFGRSLADELLEPTRIYVKPVRALLEQVEPRAIAHITGGGLVENPPRVIPDTLAFRLYPERWPVPRVMRLIGERGPVAEEELRRTFNMGLGLLIVVPPEDADRTRALLGEIPSWIVGELVPRTGSAVEFVA
ncbi:MAG: phosphoribosylformylglycinamidine cyclo-ligase [Deltaproteobacteria bacterium]|nr:phosphoribosylformylglycinamidine cyclo-ligase [Deltaproteobacteria bacterium]